jgi:nucleolar complex protein 3
LFAVKKVTLELRSSEKVLLNYYRNYLAHLEKLIEPLRRKGNVKCPQSSRLGVVALDCLAQMLDARPSFNFAPNLVRLLVPFLDHRMPEARDRVAKSVASVLKNDRKGEISLEVSTCTVTSFKNYICSVYMGLHVIQMEAEYPHFNSSQAGGV